MSATGARSTCACRLCSRADASGAIAFCLLDIDRFKSINDVHGHAAGDAVLRELGQLLRRHESEQVLATRWGGEEFLVAVRVADSAGALAWAERLRSEIAALRVDLGSGQTLGFTASIGLACYPFDRRAPQRLPWERVLDLADQALYAAKRGGRDRVFGVRPGGATGADLAARLRAAPATLFEDGTLQLLSPPASA